jgi:hypothetical protein
VVFDEQA